MADNNVEQQQEERPDIYYFPDNYTNSGRIFNGMIEVRNLIEAITIAVIMIFVEMVLCGIQINAKGVAIMIITIGPFFLVGLIGINGDSLSQFFIALINFLKNKRKLRYRRIVKNAKTTNSRTKSRPTNSKKKTSRTQTKN